MAEPGAVLDIVDAVKAGPEQVKAALEQGKVVFRVHSLPRAQLRIRARKRIIRLDEGKLAKLEKELVKALVEARGGPIRFEEYAKRVGDFKAAAAYLSFLWRNGIVRFEDQEATLNVFMAANAFSQKTYEHKIAKVVGKTFQVDLEKIKSGAADEITCVQAGGRVLCRYVAANLPRSQAKAEVRALIEAAGFKPA